MFKEQEKLNIYFFILALILSATFCLLFLENFKSYNSQITILFIPKNEKMAIQSEQVVKNLTEFPHYLSFYEKLLVDNENIEDEFIGYSKDKRKELWNKKLEISRENNSGLIEIGITGEDQVESEKIAKQAAFTLFGTASRYYNIKNEIDLRIIDGPITSVKIKNWAWLISLSVILGAFSSFLITVVCLKSGNFLLNGFRFISKIFYRQKLSSKIEKNKEKEKLEIKAEYPLFTSFEKSMSQEKKSQAPSNLPIVEDPCAPVEDIRTDKTRIVKEKVDLTKEPNEEELKERLNQLLRGEL